MSALNENYVCQQLRDRIQIVNAKTRDVVCWIDKDGIHPATLPGHVAILALINAVAPLHKSGLNLRLLNSAEAVVTGISIDGTLTSNSDVIIPTQKAVKTYVDTPTYFLRTVHNVAPLVNSTFNVMTYDTYARMYAQLEDNNAPPATVLMPIKTTSQFVIEDTTASTTKTTGALTVAGGVGISGAVNCGATIVADTTDSSSTTTGALQTTGGAGIAKSLWVGNNIHAQDIYAVNALHAHSLAIDYVGDKTFESTHAYPSANVDMSNGWYYLPADHADNYIRYVIPMPTDITVVTGAINVIPHVTYGLSATDAGHSIKMMITTAFYTGDTLEADGGTQVVTISSTSNPTADASGVAAALTIETALNAGYLVLTVGRGQIADGDSFVGDVKMIKASATFEFPDYTVPT
jgi:hypothetical protein